MSKRANLMKVGVATIRSIAMLFSIAVILLVTAISSEGAQQRFLLEWSGESQGTRASAKGFLLIDDGLLNNPGSTEFPAVPFIKDFRIVVSRAANRSHNGIFNAADFGSIALDFSGAGGDLTRELFGQGEFLGLNLVSENPNAPSSVSAGVIQTGGGSGDVLLLTSFRPLASTNALVYKCTFSARGLYNYGVENSSGIGVEEWASKRYSGRASYYMILDPGSGLMSFIWVDSKLRQFQRLIDCSLPEFSYFQKRAPSTKSPAGTWEVGIPLWQHREEIDLDPPSGTPDATRSRSLFLIGAERLTTFRLPVARISLRDVCASSLSGSFCQVTSYDGRHYAYSGIGKRATLSWGGGTKEGSGFSSVMGKLSCRLDTKFTAVAIENGGGLADGENAVVEYLLSRKWTAHADIDYAGGPLSLQPTGAEVLEPLIP